MPCQIFNTLAASTHYLTFISFSVLPTIRARQSDVNATADIGSSALLACDADGFPEPTVTWAQYVTRCCQRPVLMSIGWGVDLSRHKDEALLLFSFSKPLILTSKEKKKNKKDTHSAEWTVLCRLTKNFKDS